jgi:hypothetical protein
MKRKPWSLIILALLHVLSPVGSLILNALRAGRTLPQQWSYWIDVVPMPLPIIYILLPMLAGIFIFLCRRWAYWAYLACIGTILLSNIYSYSTNMTLGTFLVLVVVALVDILVVAYFMVPSVQQVYFDPRMRWWEAAPRYNFDTEGIVNGGRAYLKNLSQGGLFMTSGPHLAEGDKVDVFWSYKGQEQTISGIVVYKSRNPAAPGYGVRFNHTVETQKQVKSVVDQLHTAGLIVIERLPGPEDSFMSWLKKLLQTGEGLFPKTR